MKSSLRCYVFWVTETTRYPENKKSLPFQAQAHLFGTFFETFFGQIRPFQRQRSMRIQSFVWEFFDDQMKVQNLLGITHPLGWAKNSRLRKDFTIIFLSK